MTKIWITGREIVFDHARAWLVCMALGLIVTVAAAEPEPGENHAGEAEEHEEEIVRLGPSELLEFGVEVRPAEGGTLAVNVALPGEVVPDPDRIAHVVPRVPGVARAVYHAIGDVVRAGDTLAVLDSRELSEMKSEFLVARERADLARTTFLREERLWGKKVSSEREFLRARQEMATSRIELRAAEQNLHAIGFRNTYLEDLTFDEDDSFLRYTMTAPFGGIIVEKHIALGEFVRNEDSAFVIADLANVWVELTVYQKDLPRIHPGQAVQVEDTQTGIEASGTITYVSPLLREDTRTATARIVLANDGSWRPGVFVEGRVAVDSRQADVLVPKSALQTFEGRTVVFLETAEGFKPQPVELGAQGGDQVEVKAGLRPGQRYATTGSFTLKAQLEKSGFASGHSH